MPLFYRLFKPKIFRSTFDVRLELKEQRCEDDHLEMGVMRKVLE